MAGDMVLWVGLAFPLVLLLLALGMERVERPLRDAAFGDRLAEFLDSARPDEVETFVSQGFAPALDRYWRRRSWRNRLRPRRTEGE